MNRRAFLASSCCWLTAASASGQAPLAQGRFAQAAAYSADRGGVSLIVVRNGVVLNNFSAPGAPPNALWPIGAATRMFAGLLAAAMVRDRLLRLDEPVSMTIGEWGADPLKSLISVESLLGGGSGVAFAPRPVGTLADALALQPNPAPGFVDDPASYLVFAELARRKLASRIGAADPAGYLVDRVLGPVGCAPMGWTRGADGAALFYDGAAVSARGWAQVGELIRRGGVWRAEQLLDGFTLSEAVRGAPAEPRAGFGLWLAPVGAATAPLAGSDVWSMRPPAPPDFVMAAGGGGQRLYICPSEHLVVARLANQPSSGWSDAAFLPLIWRDL